MGLLVSGGSMATLTALAVARHVKSGVDVRADGLRDVPAPAAFYMSTEAHGCARKAIELLGFGSASIRTIPVGRRVHRMDLAALAAALDGDRAHGVRPIAVIATAGTTNTGAIDDLSAIADSVPAPRVWLHVDARLRRPGDPVDRVPRRAARRWRAQTASRSIRTSGCSSGRGRAGAGPRRRRDAVDVQPGAAVSAHRRQPGGVGGPPWFSEYGFQQTRGFRALKVWMTMQQLGLNGYRAAIEANIALARYLVECVRRRAATRTDGAAEPQRRVLPVPSAPHRRTAARDRTATR